MIVDSTQVPDDLGKPGSGVRTKSRKDAIPHRRRGSGQGKPNMFIE